MIIATLTKKQFEVLTAGDLANFTTNVKDIDVTENNGRVSISIMGYEIAEMSRENFDATIKDINA